MSFDASWLSIAVEKSKDRAGTGLNSSASLLQGKRPLLTVEVVDGRVVGEVDGDTACDVPFSITQIENYLAGEMKISVAYMRGDLKPTGSTRAILAVIDALDALNEPH